MCLHVVRKKKTCVVKSQLFRLQLLLLVSTVAVEEHVFCFFYKLVMLVAGKTLYFFARKKYRHASSSTSFPLS